MYSYGDNDNDISNNNGHGINNTKTNDANLKSDCNSNNSAQELHDSISKDPNLQNSIQQPNVVSTSTNKDIGGKKDMNLIPNDNLHGDMVSNADKQIKTTITGNSTPIPNGKLQDKYTLANNDNGPFGDTPLASNASVDCSSALLTSLQAAKLKSIR